MTRWDTRWVSTFFRQEANVSPFPCLYISVIESVRLLLLLLLLFPWTVKIYADRVDISSWRASTRWKKKEGKKEEEGDDFGVQSLTNDFKSFPDSCIVDGNVPIFPVVGSPKTGILESGIWTRHFGAKVFHGTGSLDLAAMPSRQFLLGDGYLQCWLKQHT